MLTWTRPLAISMDALANIIAGDFNQVCLKTVLPKFILYVKCATRENDTPDHVYCNIKHACKTEPHPHVGQSDPLSLHLIPTYTPNIRKSKLATRVIKTLPEDALSQLQDYFATTDWNLFESQVLEEFIVTVLSYNV